MHAIRDSSNPPDTIKCSSKIIYSYPLSKKSVITPPEVMYAGITRYLQYIKNHTTSNVNRLVTHWTWCTCQPAGNSLCIDSTCFHLSHFPFSISDLTPTSRTVYYRRTLSWTQTERTGSWELTSHGILERWVVGCTPFPVLATQVLFISMVTSVIIISGLVTFYNTPWGICAEATYLVYAVTNHNMG